MTEKKAGKTRADGAEPGKLRYQLVYDAVVDLIRDRDLQPGDKLPSISELGEISGVSMISVRHALDKLEREGRIIRHQGVGTFVAERRIMMEPSRSGELLQTLSTATRPADMATQLIHLAVGMPSEGVAHALSIPQGQPVWEILRLRSLRDKPAILERAILPLNLVPTLDQEMLASGASLYRFLSDTHGLNDTHIEQFFEVVPPSRMEQQKLKIGNDELVVRIRGVSFTSDDVPFDCWQQTYRASDFIFSISGVAERRLVKADNISPWTVTPFPTVGGN
ncbi:GntR family transcriptional regulator [Rhizobium sp. AQ_MP]|uniref:GntR family transcriptional regulator n=1 Tax=Rhizobium sp. AQ_MP TaxID=2761536 RepID=UPI001639DBC9|nr:GntR family transcriptional regulator [Rhizobium sp. AQ_MP]MBC2775542.1 GntR family transcriptional regulator [Rhizobium sp. AQ_MP]